MENWFRKYQNIMESVLDVKTPTVNDLVRKYNVSIDEIEKQVKIGMKVEAEHSSDENIQREIALDHLGEKLDYYELLSKVEESEILDEMPLPNSWDKSVYRPYTSFKKKIDYAIQMAHKIGKGSARTAFVIEYEGRQTVLKIAHNAKGLAQNEAEANILRDHYAKSMDILIPMIDYDEEHPQPIWIHTEKAIKVSESTLCKIMKCETLFNWLGVLKLL